MSELTRPPGQSAFDRLTELGSADEQRAPTPSGRNRPRSPFRLQSLELVADLLRIFDILAVVVCGLLADALVHAFGGHPSAGLYYGVVLGAGLLTPFIFSRAKAYRTPRVPAEERWVQTAVTGLLVLFAIIAACLAIRDANTPAARSRDGLWILSCACAVLGSRRVAKQVSGGVGKTIAIVGANETAARIVEELRSAAGTHYPIELLGVFDDRVLVRDAERLVPVDGSVEDLIARCLHTPVHHIVLALPASAQSRLVEIVDRLKALSIEVTVCPEADASLIADGRPAVLGPMVLIPLARPPLGLWDQACKRVLDAVVAFLTLIFLAPVLVVICIAIRLDSPGPVLFRQKRGGLNGREFLIYKFRSMFVEAADPLGARQTERNDARVTRIGRVLRASSLDEVPQLLNVLEGTMSLVGPRPHPIGMRTESKLCEEIAPRYAHRHQVKPGITGWAQVHGCRGATTTADDLLTRIAFDIDYIEHWSIWLDLKILLLTPALLLLGERPKTQASSTSNRIAALALICLVSMLGPRNGSAATYYVAAGVGRDAAAGSSVEPWRTLQRSVTALRPGDRLVVRAGRYAEPMIAAVSGTPQRPIEIIGEGRPLVEANDDAITLAGSYLLLRGFEAHSSGWGSAIVVGKNNHHVRIVDNVARDSACGGISAVQTDYLTVEGNRVFGNARRAPWQCSGISIYEAVAADAAPGFHNEISHNIIYDNMNVFVDNNVTHSNGKTTDGNGIIVDDNDHSQNTALSSPYAGATLIRDNIVFDNGGRGIHVFRSSNVVIVNNVCYHDLKDPNLQRPAAELSAAFSRGVKMFDNIAVARAGESGMMDGYSDGFDVWDYNLVVAAEPQAGVQSNARWGGHNLLNRDPQFIRADIRPSADFRLTGASPGRGAGGVIRLGGPDLATISAATGADIGLSGR